MEAELTRRRQKRPWLSEASGVELSTINSWVANDRWPRVDHAHQIAKALNVSLDYLMTGEHPARQFEDETIAEIIDYLEGLRPRELQQTYGMIKLAKAIQLSDGVGGRADSERDRVDA